MKFNKSADNLIVRLQFHLSRLISTAERKPLRDYKTPSPALLKNEISFLLSITAKPAMNPDRHLTAPSSRHNSLSRRPPASGRQRPPRSQPRGLPGPPERTPRRGASSLGIRWARLKHLG